MTELVAVLEEKLVLKKWSLEKLIKYSKHVDIRDCVIVLFDKVTYKYVFGFFDKMYELNRIVICIPSKLLLYVSEYRVDERNPYPVLPPYKYNCPSPSKTGIRCRYNNLIELDKNTDKYRLNETTYNSPAVTKGVNIEDDYDIYVFVQSDYHESMKKIPVNLINNIKVTNPVAEFAVANALLEKDPSRTSLPTTSVRDVASFLNPNLGPPQTKKGGRKYKRRSCKRKTVRRKF